MRCKLLVLAIFFAFMAQAQERYWSSPTNTSIQKDKRTERGSYPEKFTLQQLSEDEFLSTLTSAESRLLPNANASIITLPNSDGTYETFKVLEASNFAKSLQDQFPNIRSYVGKGITDKYATVRISTGPRGIQAMIIRAGKSTEFIEPYSVDHTVYAVYKSQRSKGALPFTCSTEEQTIASKVQQSIASKTQSNSGTLLDFRLAISCTGEYANYFGATSSADEQLVLDAFNATMTRVNGIFENDFAIHMTLIPETVDVIYYVPFLDPYSSAFAGASGAWNAELQNTLTSQIGEENYDIGHLFGASGGGGNAGCIGCVCVDNAKGSGYTSPADAIPEGDNFDVDYVAHEMGHQFGANHTFSNSNEGTGVNVEPGSGSTIMGYAGITPYDVQPHSDDYFHYASIYQVETNMATKTCPTVTTLVNNAPVADAGDTYIIPMSTPFVLTGSATDADGDALTYTWEEIDNVVSGQTGANSGAYQTKPAGPNWRSYTPVSTPERYFPRIESIINNQNTTTGTDINVEALSSVSRSLTFALTVRDNNIEGGQTDTDGTLVNVTNTAGPFVVSYPNTSVQLEAASEEIVTWDVAGTTGNGVNAADVDIYLSVDGGYTYPYTLAVGVPNDGSHPVTIPNVVGTTNRIMVKGHNHIFFDISNANFEIVAPSQATFLLNPDGSTQNQSFCQGTDVIYNFDYETVAGFTGATTFSLSGEPTGSVVTFSNASTTTDGTFSFTISNTVAVTPGMYELTLTGTSGSEVKNTTLYLEVLDANFGTQTLVAPSNNATAVSLTAELSWDTNSAADSYLVEVSSDNAFNTIVDSSVTTSTTYTTNELMSNTIYYWRVLPSNEACEGAYSATNQFTTANVVCDSSYENNTVVNVPDGFASNVPGAEVTKTIVIPASETGNISNVEVNLGMSHSYIEDLVVWIEHPDGTTVTLWDRYCTNQFSSVSYTFTDGGTPLVQGGSCNSATGEVDPAEPLSVFVGKPIAGTWTLHAQDYWNVDTGSLNNWSLNLCSEQALSTDNVATVSDFAVYPNPNSGNFNIQLNSTSGKDITVGVFDIRGRKIFNNLYTNNGFFNQEISLQSVESGVYLVTVDDGVSKETKKIIVE